MAGQQNQLVGKLSLDIHRSKLDEEERDSPSSLKTKSCVCVSHDAEV